MVRDGKPIGDVDAEEVRRFFEKIARDGDCWIWTGAKNEKGYGRFKVDGRAVYPHRLAYRLFVGEIPEGMTIDHTCNNPSCCNPKHLELVTNQENLRRRDYRKMIDKAEDNPFLKQTEEVPF